MGKASSGGKRSLGIQRTRKTPNGIAWKRCFIVAKLTQADCSWIKVSVTEKDNPNSNLFVAVF